jgi:hypothetical protein
MSLLATEKLSSKEADEYAKCKWKIQEHKKTWKLFAEAMTEIRDKRLYRQDFSSFEKFCETLGLYEKRSIDRMIQAYKISQELGRRRPKCLVDVIDAVEHWLALKDVPEDRIEAVFKRIEKDRNGKPVTTAIINKAIHGPTGKPIAEPPKADPKPESETEKEPVLVEGTVLSTTTVTSTTQGVNSKPSSGSQVSAPTSKSEVVNADVKPSPVKPEAVVPDNHSPSVSVESVLKGALTKVDGLDLLDELLRHLIAEGSEYSVAEICKKHVVESGQPVVVQVDDPEEIARGEKAIQGQKGMIVSTLQAPMSLESLDGNTIGSFASTLMVAIPPEVREDFVNAIKSTWKVMAKKKFVPPTLEEVKAYFSEKKTHIDPVVFYEHYVGTGWKKSDGTDVEDWKGCLRTFKSNQPLPHPTLDEVRKYCEENKSKVNPDFFYHTYKASGWMHRGTRVKDWRAQLETHRDDPKFCKRVPTLDEVRQYVAEVNGKIPAETFFNHYESNGWMVGVAPVVDWKTKYKTWPKDRTDSEGQKDAAPVKTSKWKDLPDPPEMKPKTVSASPTVER